VIEPIEAATWGRPTPQDPMWAIDRCKDIHPLVNRSPRPISVQYLTDWVKPARNPLVRNGRPYTGAAGRPSCP
jgi:hypothetical protein